MRAFRCPDSAVGDDTPSCRPPPHKKRHEIHKSGYGRIYRQTDKPASYHRPAYLLAPDRAIMLNHHTVAFDSRSNVWPGIW
jgi:hypothetical protein